MQQPRDFCELEESEKETRRSGRDKQEERARYNEDTRERRNGKLMDKEESMQSNVSNTPVGFNANGSV